MTVAVTLILRNSRAEVETLPWEKWVEAWGADLVLIRAQQVEEAFTYKVSVEPREVTENQLTLEGEGSSNQTTTVSANDSSPSEKWVMPPGGQYYREQYARWLGEWHRNQITFDEFRNMVAIAAVKQRKMNEHNAAGIHGS